MKRTTKIAIFIVATICLITTAMFFFDYYNIFSKLGINASLLNFEFWSIYSAIIGGLIGGLTTLLGVVLTIDDNSQKQLENERKKFSPWINYYTGSIDTYDHYVNVEKTNFEGENIYEVDDIILHNSDISHFLLKGISFNGHYCTIDPNSYIKKDWMIIISLEDKLIMPDSIKTIALDVEDLLGNGYWIGIDFDLDHKTNEIQCKGCFRAQLKK